jgi:prolyl oligopeptidase
MSRSRLRVIRRLGRHLTVLCLASLFVPPTATGQQVRYPATTRDRTVDDYHGTRVADPYRWLEDLNSEKTAEWVKEQNAVTERFLSSLPQRATLLKRMTALWNYPRTTVPKRLASNILFYQRNSGLQRQGVVVARSSAETPPKVIIDPNAMWPAGDTALAQFEPAPDGRHIAYAVAAGGADWQDVRIRRVRDRRDLADVVHWVRFSGLSWTKDGQGFFYSRYPARDEATKLSAALEHQKVYYHRLGTPQGADVLVFERPDLPTWFVSGTVSEDGRYLFVYLSRGADARNRLYLMELGDPKSPNVKGKIRAIVEQDDGEYSVIGNLGTTLYLRTDLNAPRRRVVAVDLARPARANWKTVVPQGPSAIAEVGLTKSALVVNRLVDVSSELSLVSLQGRAMGRVPLPGPGSVAGLGTTSDAASFYFAFTSHLYPTTVLRYDATTKKSTSFEPRKLAFEPSGYETHRVFATSKDGTRVPLFVSHRKGLERNGENPTLLYAYGGFAVDLVPSFSPAALAFMEQGGVFVTASLRGGAEYGEEWHQAGMKEKKQNVFDDFIGAAEFLIKEKYTSPGKLVINGGSNGGLLVGAVMTQRPELFAVAMPQVGVLDMLRYHKFTGGAAWATEYGSADDPEAFKYLSAYSPIHRIKPGTCYPATIITTADHDDRVVPSHSYKFTATLQRAQGCDKPVLIRVETKGSHGYRPTDRLIAEMADLMSFALSQVSK